MDIYSEIKLLQDTMAGKAKPVLSAPATCGRLAELYLQLPDPSHYAEAAKHFAATGLELVQDDDPLYQRLRHIEAMAMRLSPIPEPGVLGVHGSAAETDRDAYERSLKVAPRDAQRIADDWGNWAWERSLWDEAGEAFSRANRALRRDLSRRVLDLDERIKLMFGTSYAARAAYAYAMAENGKEALLELERGNGAQFRTQEDVRLVERLHREHPDVAAWFDQIKAAMNAQMGGPGEGFAVDDLGHFSQDALSTDRALDDIVQEIRGLNGYESFGSPADWNDIVAAVGEVPVIWLALTDKGTALIGVKKADDGELSITAAILKVSLADLTTAAMPFFKAEYEYGTDDRIETLMALLEWLGGRITLPVYQALEQLDHKDKPFLLAPTGSLSLVPIHAGQLPIGQGGSPHFFFHPKNVSYCYWARGLARSMQRRAERVTEGALVINNPKPLPPQYDPLEMADFEAKTVLSHIPGAELKGIDADTEMVCTALPKANLAHFCCHGTVARTLSYSGILLLAQSETLTYKHLREMSLDARLVVLSACRSGAAAIGLDQVLSLPAMFLAAGASGVLGSFWHTDDLATLLLMMRFYSLWCDGGLEPTEALGQAQAWLLSSTTDTLRKTLPAEVLALPAAGMLNVAAADDQPYNHPWYWAGFFMAGV